MRNFLLVPLLLALAPYARAGEIDFAGRIGEVTVYTSGSARVTRSGTVLLPAGKRVLRSAPLPPKIDLGSVQVSVKGIKGRVAMDSVETRRVPVDDTAIEGKLAEHRKALKAQEERVYDAELAVRGAADRIQGRRETLRLLEQLRKQAGQIAGKEIAVQNMAVNTWAQALDLTESRSDLARKAVRDLEKRGRKLREELDAERRKLRELRLKRPKEDYHTRLYVTLNAAKASKAKVRIQYNVRGASWEPSYRVNADVGSKRVALDIFGSIRQESGEDWKDVILSLSTARPDIGTDIPELQAWYIRTAEAAPSVMKAGRGMSEMDMAIPVPSGARPLPPVPAAPPTRAVSAGVATVFKARSKADIPSDGQRHKIPVETISSSIETEHVAIPKLLPHAFLKARTANNSPFPLLEGPVDVLAGDSFVGRGNMKLTAPGESIQLSLGVDENVKVERNLLSDKVQRKRRGDRVETTNVFEIKATNFSSKPVTLVVMDQLPISRSERVKVTYGSSARKALRGAEFPGQLKWTLELLPGTAESIKFDFTLEYPQQMKRNLEMLNAPAMQMMDMNQASPISF